ncbi:MAG: hypothetical protein Q4D38_01360 [Planctomycetia bacterium]|nr:hypothetical protein [Planctomycetia bacterium]
MNMDEKIVFQWGRIEGNADWILPILALLAAWWIVLRIYRYDGRELRTLWRWLLPALRMGAIFVLFVIYLEPQWRTERQTKQNSQVAIFVDVSQSMTLPESDAPTAPQRSAAATKLLFDSPLLKKMNEKHDLIFVGFDDEARKLQMFPMKSWSGEKSGENTSEVDAELAKREALRRTLEQPQGTRSAPSDAIRAWLNTQPPDAPLAAVVLCTDGAQNQGGEPSAAARSAQKMGVPIYSIGIGSASPLENYRLYEMEAPVRVQPHDPFFITGLVQGVGFGGISEDKMEQESNSSENSRVRVSAGRVKMVRVELHLLPQSENWTPESAENSLGESTLLQTQEILLGEEGRVVPVRFEIEPPGEGKFAYLMRVVPVLGERITSDNARVAEVEIIDRKLRALICAGGPTREYQFLLAAFYRDKTIESHVLLQSARPGASQEGDKMLVEFPQTREELFSYDCILAIDPDWQRLSPAQVEWLDEWLVRQAGGLLLIAGPVYMGESVGGWIEDPNFERIRAFYPVEFQKRFSAARQNTYLAERAWALDFSREGVEAEFLRLGDSLSESVRAWDEFEGVYGYFPTKNLKPGATALAYFSNPRAKNGDQKPILIASQFYGSGRILYFGTGEFWRLRTLNPDYFVRFYTQIVRYVAQGRMAQQSTRGRLMLTKDSFAPGDSIDIRAQLFDAQLAPLSATAVEAEVFLPDGRIQSVKLAAEPEQPGTFVGSFSTILEGTLRIELPIPQSEERLARRVEIVLSDVEREKPQKNMPLLETLARDSGGRAFESPDDAEIQSLPEIILGKTRVATISSMADPVFEREFMWKMLCIFVGLLSVEWFLRRILKLA